MIQYFMENEFSPVFEDQSLPEMQYISKIAMEDSVHPRVMHSHEDSVEIILICSGEGEYFIAGNRQKIKPGDVIIYNSNVIHDEMSGPNMKIASYCCAIGNIHIKGLRKNALIPDTKSPTFPSGEYFPVLENIYQMMFKEISSEKQHSEQVCHYLMMALISMVTRIVAETKKDSVSKLKENHIGLKIKAYIDEFYRKDLTLQLIADEMNISPYYLSHAFKEATGYSPVQYIQRRRIGHAQTLLITTNLTVTEIASMVGYDNPSHFNLIFTKNVGRPPLKYRKNYTSLAGKKIK